MFKLAKDSLFKLSLDPKYLGAEIGITAVLHSWGQNLSFHPHVHCIVPGGGISSSGIEFKRSRKKFFLPVKALSILFMNKFLEELRRLLLEERLFVPAQLDAKKIITECFEKKWVIYCKPPFKSSFHVIEYLSRYTHKIAITDSRIVSSDSDTVTFNWRDYSDNNKKKIMALSSGEFVRRFLLHVLPRKFVKIRYYGILGTRNRKTKLLKCQVLSGMKSIYKARSKAEILRDILGEKALCCPNCGSTLVRHDSDKKTTLRE
jgi:hypothetical protein